MLGLDEFESAFKSAAKQRYDPTTIEIRKVLVVNDAEDGEGSRLFTKDVSDFLAPVLSDIEWLGIGAADYEDAGDLLDLVERHHPDVIVTYRNLLGRARRYPFSLGAHVDVLTQATTTPVLLLPPPTTEGRLAPDHEHTEDVLVLTDHLTGSDTLVDWAVRFCTKRLLLAHLEDDAVFQRYIEVISKLPSIDTDTARADIAEQLLKEPRDYVGSIQDALADSKLEVASAVEMGHHVADVKRLVSEHEVDLLVMNTKDEDQLAMHGLAYALAVELRDIPQLLL